MNIKKELIKPFTKASNFIFDTPLKTLITLITVENSDKLNYLLMWVEFALENSPDEKQKATLEKYKTFLETPK